MTEVEETTTELTWEDALDDAVMSINGISDIESEDGQAQLKEIIERLKWHQARHKHYADRHLLDRLGEDGQAQDDENAVKKTAPSAPIKQIFYLLPWQAAEGTLRPE